MHRTSALVWTVSVVLAAVLLPGALQVPQSKPALPLPLGPSLGPNLVDMAPGEFRIVGLPVSLNQPGLYRFGGSLTASALMSATTGPEAFGIVVRSSHVTIDLGGFELVGATNMISGIVAIATRGEPPLVNLCVRHGTVRQWGGWGIDASVVSGTRFQDLCLLRNGGAAKSSGGLLAGLQATITGCLANWNTSVGISAGDGSLVTQCVTSFNEGTGMALARASSAVQCNATQNTGFGFDSGVGTSLQNCMAGLNGGVGFSTSTAATLRDCDAWGNSVGIAVAGDALVVGSHVADNGGAGIYLRGDGTRADSNHLTGNGVGLMVAGRANVIVRNSFSGNASALQLPPGNTSGGLYEAPSPYAVQQPDAPSDPLDALRPWANVIH